MAYPFAQNPNHSMIEHLPAVLRFARTFLILETNAALLRNKPTFCRLVKRYKLHPRSVEIIFDIAEKVI